MSASDFAEALHRALGTRPHSLSPKYFYDAAGSHLFDAICELHEYYPTRTELALLHRHADEIAALIGPDAELVEYGAGSLRKVRLLLDAMRRPAGYLPIDISAEHLAQAALALQRDHPALVVRPLVADFTTAFLLPPAAPGVRRRIGFFPGSTIGNLDPEEALAFLRQAAAQLQGGALLLGIDRIKAPEVLHAAYNDAQGVTAAFNLNLLARANRELGSDFELGHFSHSAFYNAGKRRVEMHLVSRCEQLVHLQGRRYELAEGESLHTENSCKFSLPQAAALAQAAGFRPGPVWSDPAQWFSLMWLVAPA